MSDFVEVRIHGQLFKLRAGEGKEHVRSLAKYVDGAIRTVVQQSRTVTTERAAIMAALNIADALFQLRRQSELESQAVNERISRVVSASDRLLKD